MGALDGRTALVAGASSGIGLATALMFAEAGAKVHAAARRADVIAEAAGDQLVAHALDVTDRDSVSQLAQRLIGEGPLHALVVAAGINIKRRRLEQVEPEDWDRVLAVNLTAAHRTMKRALGAMVSARFGRIVNISTISAAQPMPGQAAYAASKAGLEALTRTAAVETAHRGITVNAIAPGLVDTDFIADVPDDWARMLPPRRTARPGEIAACVGFLVSESAAYVNGATLRADGGLTAGIRIGARRSRPQAGDQRPSEEPHGHRITGAG